MSKNLNITKSNKFNKPNAIIPSMQRLSSFDPLQVQNFDKKITDVEDDHVKKQNLNNSELTICNYFEEILKMEGLTISTQNNLEPVKKIFENLNGN